MLVSCNKLTHRQNFIVSEVEGEDLLQLYSILSQLAFKKVAKIKLISDIIISYMYIIHKIHHLHNDESMSAIIFAPNIYSRIHTMINQMKDIHQRDNEHVILEHPSQSDSPAAFKVVVTQINLFAHRVFLEVTNKV